MDLDLRLNPRFDGAFLNFELEVYLDYEAMS